MLTVTPRVAVVVVRKEMGVEKGMAVRREIGVQKEKKAAVKS